MTTNNYSSIRFVGYAIPTGPKAKNGTVGTGTYLGDANREIDMQARILILKNAVDTAQLQLPESKGDHSVLNVFVAPEFYFHGVLGPYIYQDEEHDPLPVLLAQLKSTFNSSDYPNWTFIFGTLVSAKVANIENVFKSQSVQARNAIVASYAQQLENASGATYDLLFNSLRDFINICQDAPNIVVRDRAIIVSTVPLDLLGKEVSVATMTSEKYYLSQEDFLLCNADPSVSVVTEQMVGYPRIDLSNGDIKKSAFDSYAIFRQNYGVNNFPAYVDFAVEVCLDHDDGRLRNNLGLEPFPNPYDGIHYQLIPSYGSLIMRENVVADKVGFVFNCDGQTTLDGTTGPQQGDLYGVQSVYANYSCGSYAAHSQLARVLTPAVGNDPNKDSATFQELSANDLKVFSVASPALPVGTFSDYFAGGVGEIHIFGLDAPYPVFG